MSMRSRPIVWKLVSVLLVFIALALGGQTYFTLHFFRQFHERMLEEKLEKKALQLEEQILAESEDGELDLQKRRIWPRSSDPGTRYMIFDETGRLAADSIAGGPADEPFVETSADRPTAEGFLTRYSFSQGMDVVVYARSVRNDQGQTLATVQVSIPANEIVKTMTGLYHRSINLLMFILVLLAVAVFAWVWRVTSPLNEVRALAERIAMGELIQIRDFSSLSSSELRALGLALNRISEQLGRNFSKYRAKKNEQGAILASMSEGVLAVDERERVTHINKAAAEMFNLAAASALGLTIYELIRIPLLQDFIRDSLSVKDFDQKEITIDEGGMDMKVLFIRCTPLRGVEGRRLGTVFVLSDVTELRKLERMRRDFVANVSHELRTPLTNIKGFSETIMNFPSEKMDENVRNFIEIIHRHANRLDALIEDLLMLSKLERDDEKSKRDFSEQKMARVALSAAEACRASAETKHISIDVQCAPDVVFFGNPNLMEQALVNLIDNAVKYSPEGKTVNVAAFDTPEEIQVQVIDSGIGIAKENFDRLFERFYRVDKGRSRDMGGTGLGLSIVKHIVQVHSGRIDVESHVGRGSKFTIHLPKTSNTNQTISS